jgi:hypothetical protein
MRTTVFRRRALVAYEVDESSGDVNIIGVFSGGQDWGAALAPGDHGSDQG